MTTQEKIRKREVSSFILHQHEIVVSGGGGDGAEFDLAHILLPFISLLLKIFTFKVVIYFHSFESFSEFRQFN
jgi:hypothetical protein